MSNEAEEAKGRPDPAVLQLAWADQGYTGDAASKAAQANRIDLQIVKLPEAK